MPITYWTCLVGTLALTGLPFLSGFYSKDTIIEAAAHVAHAASRADGWTWWISHYAYFAVLLGVFVTSFYSFRLLYLTFHGAERFHAPLPDHYVAPEADTPAHADALAHAAEAEAEAAPAHDDDAHAGHAHDDAAHDHDAHGHGHGGAHVPHESPLVVTIPLILLAIPSLLVGVLTIGPMLAGGFFDGAITVLPAHDAMAHWAEEFHGAGAFALHGLLGAPFLLALAGFLLATLVYVVNPELHGRARRFFRIPVAILENKYGFDDLWIKGFADGGLELGQAAAKYGDAGLIDGLIVNGSAWVVDRVAALLRKLQSGVLYHYAFAMIVGLIALLAALIWQR
jgi:NADH-quinone oxidoreductase subunit L